MAAASLALGFAADVALGIFLLGAAWLLHDVWRRPGRRALAAYLALVGVNYVLNGTWHLVEISGGETAGLRRVANATGALDPAFLLLFALAATGVRLPPWAQALLVAPGALLALGRFTGGPLGAASLAAGHLAVLYAFSFLLVLGALLRTEDPKRAQLLAALVLAMGLIVLPRIPLAYVDVGLAPFRGGRARPETLFVFEGGLLLGYAATAAAGWLAPRTLGRDRALRVVQALGGLLLIVEFAWLLRFVPPFQASAFALLYSARWFVFCALLVVAARRQDVLGLPEAVARRVQRAFTLLIFALMGAQVASLLAALDDQAVGSALLGGLAIVGMGLVIVVAFRRAVRSSPDELAWRRIAVYRARLELGATDAELHALRRELGLSERTAREVRALVRAERAAAPPAAPSPLREGAVFAGRYEVGPLAGGGSFGRVWSALDRASGERVVLKELLTPWQQDTEAVARFRREAEVAMTLQHPNLVAFRGLERGGDGHVLVLGHVEGEPLRARLARGPLSEAEARPLARGLLAALAALHDAGLVHRDVKPENIILRGDGTAVLVDLGAAGPSRGATLLSARRGHPGTPAYMAPEQRRGEDAGPAADLYAAGVVLWEALAGRPPPHGRVGDAWRVLLERALADDPARRWPSAEAFRAALP